MRKNTIQDSSALAALLWTTTSGSAQPQADSETDPAVLKRIDWFQDQKFGLLMHWGPYSQWAS